MGIGGQGQPAWDDDEVLEDMVRYLSSNDDDNWDHWKDESWEGKKHIEILRELCPTGVIRLWWKQDANQEVGACQWRGSDLECTGYEGGLPEFEVTCDERHGDAVTHKKIYASEFGY